VERLACEKIGCQYAVGLSAGTANGVVTVKATSKENAEISGTCEITVAIPDVTAQSEIIEDCSDDKNSKNPKITWSETGWSNPYTGEADKHHGGTKTETSTEGAWFSYTFTGTGIKFYAQKNNTQGKFTVELDGKAESDAVLWEEKSGGSPQQCVFEKTDLENTEHTIKFTAATDHGNINVNIDYLEVFTPAAASVDKSALQAAIEKYSGLNKDDYAENLWNEFKTAYDNAVKGMNDDKTTKEQADKLAADLNAAGAKLEAAEIPAPTIPEDAKATVMGVTSTEATVSWTKLPRAESYKVYAVEHEGTAKALKAITDTVPDNAGEPVTTTETTVRFTNLKPGTSYVFMIVGVNHNKVESEKALCSEPFTTVAAADEKAPAQVSGISVVKEGEKDVKITWAPSEDPEGSEVTYIVYVDGVIVSESDKTEYTLKNADESKGYSIRIVAVDASGNKAVPAVINLTVDDWNAKTVVGVEKPADLKVKKGTAADKLDLPKTVNVTLEGGRVADVLEVKWTTDNYKADQIGMLATVMNCIYVSDLCRYTGMKTEIYTPFACGAFTKLYSKDSVEESFAQGKLVFFAGGTGHPYFSTDTGAVLRAIEIEADAMLLAKAIDGIYDSDPKVNPSAKKYDQVSIQEVIDKKLAVVDLTASVMCMENHIPMYVFGLGETNSIVNAVNGQFNGTVVTVD